MLVREPDLTIPWPKTAVVVVRGLSAGALPGVIPAMPALLPLRPRAAAADATSLPKLYEKRRTSSSEAAEEMIRTAPKLCTAPAPEHEFAVIRHLDAATFIAHSTMCCASSVEGRHATPTGIERKMDGEMRLSLSPSFPPFSSQWRKNRMKLLCPGPSAGQVYGTVFRAEALLFPSRINVMRIMIT